MVTQTKNVCIIGAGPSGLVAAKALTSLPNHPNFFHVTIFEKTSRIGGLWPLSPEQNDENNRLVNPSMRTNQSRHTVSFSDLAWPGADEHSIEKHAQFPEAWEVGQYLERYWKKYGGEWEVRLGCEVVKTEKLGEGGWEVSVHVKEEGEAGEMTVEVHEFDHVIIASGFFGAPRLPSSLPNSVSDVPVWHSSKFRDVRSLITDGGRLKVDSKGNGDGKRKIVVVGGQMSGVEVAANVALQLSDCVNAPGKEIMDWKEWEVVHVVQKPVWVIPLFLPSNPQLDGEGKDEKINNPAPNFLPCDLVTYNLSYKPPGELQNTGGHISVEAAKATHSFLNMYLGSDQSELGYTELTMKGPLRSEPPYLAVSDEYNEFVRSGSIKIVRGHGKDFSRLRNGVVTIEDDMDASSRVMSHEISNISAVILATGFDASASLKFLPKEILETLQFTPDCEEFPLALDVNTVVNHSLPSLGFVGFYRSPYWGVMEMQARYLAKLWSGDAEAAKALAEDTSMETMLKLRRDPRQGQFPMGDYAYLMESFAKILGIKRLEPDSTKDTRSGLVFPPRYTYSESSDSEKSETMLALTTFNNTFTDSEKGKFLARAVFRAMQGDWKLERQIESFISTYPSGTFSATAKLQPRRPTEKGYDGEYLYVESGEFLTTTGMRFTAKRSYAHRYTSSTDTLSAWFIKPDDKTVDYFFHELIFTIPPAGAADPSAGWKATSSHFCTPDTYDVQYEFKFHGVQLKEWVMAYTVKGPQKDYKLKSVYTR